MPSVNVPRNWSEVTLRQFMALGELHSDEGGDAQERAFVTISIMTGADPDDIRRWSMDSFNRVWSTLNFLTEQPTAKRVSKFSMSGKTYRVATNPLSMSYGAFIDLMHFCKDEQTAKKNLHRCFAACIQQRGKWPWSAYTYEVVDPEKILDLPVTLVIPHTAFFLANYLRFSRRIVRYSALKRMALKWRARRLADSGQHTVG